MLEAVTPKITDISSIKGISALLALPMLCIAYVLQSGAVISWDDVVWFDLGEELPEQNQLYRLAAIFVIKSIWVSFFGLLLYGAITYVHINIRFPVVQLVSTLMLAFALFGIICSSKFVQLKLLDPFWFYSLIVWGLFLQTMKDQLDAEKQKLEASFRERARARSAA